MTDWKTIDSAPRDKPIVVWYNHYADTTYCLDSSLWSDYACHAHLGNVLEGSGFAVVQYFREYLDEFDEDNLVPGAWVVIVGDNPTDPEYVCNATHWLDVSSPYEEENV